MQCVADPDSPAFKTAEKLRSEWVVRIDGKVRRRPASQQSQRIKFWPATRQWTLEGFRALETVLPAGKPSGR